MGCCIGAFAVLAAAFMSVVFRPQVARISFMLPGGVGRPEHYFPLIFRFLSFVTVWYVAVVACCVSKPLET